MIKPRPEMVISPKISNRPRLCTVVALSTMAPEKIMPYHRQIDLNPVLPPKFESQGIWIKGDMVNAVSLDRINLIWKGKHPDGSRKYIYAPQSDQNIIIAKQCILRALGMSALTKHV